MRPPVAQLVMVLVVLGAAATAFANPDNPPAKAASAAGKTPKRKLPPLTRLPRLLRSKPAPYPPKALAENREGSVVLQLGVDAKGRVTQAKVVVSGGPEFDAAALEAVRTFEFSPAIAGGKPVPVSIRYRYRFQLRQKKTVRTVKKPVVQKEGPRAISFKGRLLERGTRVPLRGVRAYLLGTGEVAVTDEEGAFTFSGVSPGVFTLTARTPQHERIREQIRVPFLGYGKGVFYLLRRPFDPYETIIRAPRVRERSVQRTIRLEEISKIPGIQGDALKVVQNLPGVARIPFGFGGLVIRGSSPQDSLAFLDGHPLPILFHFLALRSVFNSDILARIDFVPGNYPASYGRLTGGILDVWTRDPKRDGYHGFVDVNIFDSGFLLEGPAGKGSFSVSGRRSYIDVILPLFLDSKAIDLTVAPVYYDYQVMFQYPVAQGHNFKVLIYGSEDELKFVRRTLPGSGTGETRGEFKNNILFHRLQLGWTYRSGRGFENSLSAAGGIDRILVAIADRASFVRDTTLISIREQARWNLRKGLKLVVGLDLLTGRERFGGTLPRIPKEGESPRVIVDDPITGEDRLNFFNPGLYVTLPWQPIPTLTITPQLRWDYFSRLKQGVLDPRLTIRWEVHKGTYLTAAAGLYHQQPFFDEISPTFGNPDLGPLKATHYSLGISHRFTQALSIDATGFYKNLSDLVVRSDRVVVRDGKLVPEGLSNDGRGEIYGLEVLLRHQLYRGFFGWIGYTLMRSTRQDDPSKPYRIFQFDQTHILTAIASYKFGSGWQIGIRWRYVTGFPFTPRVGGIYDADSDRYRPISGDQLSERIPAFHQLDLRIDKTWAFKTWKLSLYLDIMNVYNRENQEAVRYNYDFTQRVPLTGLPIIPAIGIRGDF